MNRDINIARLFEDKQDSFDRFMLAREYLDAHNQISVDKIVLQRLIFDELDLIRAEVADFAILNGGLSDACLIKALSLEKSELVRPRLWLALCLLDGKSWLSISQDTDARDISVFEKSYFNAAGFTSTGDPFYLYELCAIACSSDFSASHSAIDLLQIVAGDRVSLLQGLAHELTRTNADNAEKARQRFCER